MLLGWFLPCHESPSWWKQDTSGKDQGLSRRPACPRAPFKPHHKSPGPEAGDAENLRGDDCL